MNCARNWLTLGLIACCLMPAPALALQKEFTLPAHTSIPLRLKYPVYGNSLRKGDRIPVAVAYSVFLGKTLVFRQGDSGVLLVEKSKHAGAFGRGGKLSLRSGSVNDVTGREHPVLLTQYTKGDSKASAVILPIVSLVVLWPLAFFALKKGEEAIIPAGSMLSGVLSEATTVTLEVPEASPPVPALTPLVHEEHAP